MNKFDFTTLPMGEVNISGKDGKVFAKAINTGGDTMTVARRLAASGEMLDLCRELPEAWHDPQLLRSLIADAKEITKQIEGDRK